MMMLAGFAASAAVDLLSLLQSQTPTAGSGARVAEQSAFELAGAEPDVQPVPAELRPSSTVSPREGMTRETLDALLSAQTQQGSERKKRSVSLLLDLLQSSQNGSVSRSELNAAAGKDVSEASELFDRIDQNHDNSINVAELTATLDAYRRGAGAGSQGKALALMA